VNEVRYPIFGSFESQKGVIYFYTVYADGTVEQYKFSNFCRSTGRRWVTYVDTTNECMKIINQRYGINLEGRNAR